jgi:hypothetical protein
MYARARRCGKIVPRGQMLAITPSNRARRRRADNGRPTRRPIEPIAAAGPEATKRNLGRPGPPLPGLADRTAFGDAHMREEPAKEAANRCRHGKHILTSTERQP